MSGSQDDEEAVLRRVRIALTNGPDHVELIDAGNAKDGYYSPGDWVKDRAGGQSSIAQLADAPLDGLGYNGLWGLCTPSACGRPRSRSC